MVELSETFWALLLTTVSGFLLVTLKFCYKSKCKTVDMCCLKIVRDVDIEKEEDMATNNLETSSQTKDTIK